MGTFRCGAMSVVIFIRWEMLPPAILPYYVRDPTPYDFHTEGYAALTDPRNP